MKNTLIITILLSINVFSYDDPFEDIVNKYSYREGLTKLVIADKSGNIRACNSIDCEINNSIEKNQIFPSSNVQTWYQIKHDQWVAPQLLSEIELYSSNDYLIKKNLESNKKYIIYKGKINNGSSYIDFQQNTLLEINNEYKIIDVKFKDYKIIHKNIVQEISFEELIKKDLSKFKETSKLKDKIDFIDSNTKKTEIIKLLL